MSENPLKIFEKLDPELLELVENTKKLALTDGALPRKFKFLIAMALRCISRNSSGRKGVGPGSSASRRYQGRDYRSTESCTIH